MSDVVAVEGRSAGPGLSQVERVVDTFCRSDEDLYGHIARLELVAAVFVGCLAGAARLRM